MAPNKEGNQEVGEKILREVDTIYMIGRYVGIEECRDALDNVIE